MEQEEQPDVELWDDAIRGRPEAFGTLFERHARAVYNYAFRRSGDWSLAEEITSTVFLEAWRRRDEVRFTTDSVRPWLLGVATNVLHNRWRSRRRHRAALDRLPRRDAERDFGDGVTDRLDDQWRVRRILKLVERLSRRHRDVLTLVVWEGLSYQETAVALGVPVGTVRSRLARARGRLADLDAELVDGCGHDRDELASTARIDTQEV